MSEARPFVWKRVEPARSEPEWLEQNAPRDRVRSLLAHLGGEPPPAPQPSAAPPEPPPPAPPPQRKAAAEPPTQREPEPPVMELPADERALSRLPPPPNMGSLIPGARSAPPPAHDANQALLRERGEAFAQAALELAIARAATLAVLEGQLLDLSTEIASALIEREVSAEPALHVALARAALASLGDSTQVTLRTSPDGFNTICAAFGGSEVEQRGVRVHVVADATIPGLGCVVDGDNVRIDATVAERLRAVRRAFEEERRKAAEHLE